MGRRSRQKAKSQARDDQPQGDVARERMARVLATDDVWTDFRAACERDVARYRSRRLRHGALEPRELVDALD
jgi:hypothetical protein